MKTSYRERDYEYGEAMLKLRTAIGLTQGHLGNLVGVSWRAVAGWEAGCSYPKTERLKALIELGVQHQTFSTGHEAEEIRMLWKLARQKVLLDEHWLSALLQGQTQDLHVVPVSVPKTANYTPAAVPPVPETQETPNYTPATVPSASETKEKSDNALAIPPLRKHEDAKAPKTTRRHKRLVGILITLVIVVITGAGGTLLLQPGAHKGEQVQQTTPTQTHSYPAYLPGNGRLSFFDPLSQESGSKWSSHNSSDGYECQFTGGVYHIIDQPNDNLFMWCEASGTFSDFAFEVELTITRGDCAGISFRDDGKHSYILRICQDGTYSINKYYTGSDITHLRANNSSAMRTGRGQQNKIAVVASGSTMTFYVNSQQIDQIQDDSSTSGSIALIANSISSDITDVAYSNARLWTL